MLVIACTCSETKNLRDIYKLHLDLSTNCLDADASSYGFSYYELREQAVVSYFGCVFQQSDEAVEVFQITRRPNLQLQKVREASDFPDLNERLLRCISDRSYEVRLATLKWFLQFLKSEDSGFSESSSIWNWAKNSLQVKLLELLEKEKNHKCENYILRIFFQWNLLMFEKSCNEKSVDGTYVGSLSYDSVIHLWTTLTSLYENTERIKIRGTLMCCLEICVKHLTGLFFHKNKPDKEEEPRLGCVIDCVSKFVRLIKQNSSPSKQLNVRHASAEAIIASGVLEHAKRIGPLVSNHQMPSETTPSKFQDAYNAYAYEILEMWFTCIKFLEDEDDFIRSKLGTDVQCFFAAMEVPTQVDKVLELIFNHLSSIFEHWNEYLQYLSGWVFNTANYKSPAEGGNDHEEKLLILQFYCYHLQKIPTRECSLAQLQNWRSQFHNQLLSFAQDNVSKQRESWVSGVGNHKDVFLPLYANLLGLYVFSNCIFRFSTDSNDKKTLFADMVELGEALKPFLSNPLVSNMFRAVVRLHEKFQDDSLVDLSTILSGEIWVWEGFDPYFLLTDREIKVDFDGEVICFYDPENVGLKLPSDGKSLVDGINSSLQKLDERYFLSNRKEGKYAIGKESAVSPEKLQHLKQENFTFIPIEEKEVKTEEKDEKEEKKKRGEKELANRIILQTMLKFASREPNKKNILLITSDSDFSIVVDTLKKNGYNVLLAVKNETEPSYMQKAKYVWDWNDMVEGRAKPTRNIPGQRFRGTVESFDPMRGTGIINSGGKRFKVRYTSISEGFRCLIVNTSVELEIEADSKGLDIAMEVSVLDD